jgi:hypothetical protein
MNRKAGEVGLCVMAIAMTLLSTAPAGAQSVGAIVGTVKDGSGGVLPGVAVEATSPALIEKVRTTVTDAEGLFRIIDLRPGTYAVTFALPGFSTLKREGVELTAGFTATVNGELTVSNLQETVTVTGQTPLIDSQNVTQRRAMTSVIIDALPTAKTFQSISTLVAGVRTPISSQDVGGSAGQSWQVLSVHGSRADQMPINHDGMPYNNMNNTGGGYNTDIQLNSGMIQEISVATGGLSAESKVSGAVTNIVPKEGGNAFRGYFFGNYTDDKFQTDNLSPKLVARGMRAANSVDKIWDVNPAGGGRILLDRLWFYGSFRYWGSEQFIAGAYPNQTPLGWRYIPDLSQPLVTCCDKWNLSEDLRLTWQASAKNKVTAHAISQQRKKLVGLSLTTAPEASFYHRNDPNYLAQLTWASPVTNKFLLEVGGTIYRETFSGRPLPGVPEGTINARELSTNTSFRGPGSLSVSAANWQRNIKVSGTYVTGSHAFKVGLQHMWGERLYVTDTPGQITVSLIDGSPVSLTQFARPISDHEFLKAALGLYVQDQWRIRRLTVNGGVRFDYHNAYVPEQHLPPVRFLGARDFAPIRDVPNWKDISPRLGVSLDIFGTGRTVFKASVARYLQSETTATATANNPVNTSVNSASREWIDRNQNFVPDCDLRNTALNGECGALSATNFGQVNVVTRYDPDTINGWGKRGFDWEINTGLQHELLPGIAADVNFNRHWYGNFLVVDDLAVGPSGYDPFCVTAPVDPRLPGGGGNQLCGYYDINPNFFGRLNRLITFAKNYGKQTDVFTGIDANLTARLPRGAVISAGISSGHEVQDNCDVVGKVDSAANATGNIAIGTFSVSALSTGVVSSLGAAPNIQGVASPSTVFCRVAPPFQSDVKVFGIYPLPWWGLQTSATFQSLPGPLITAQYAVNNAQVLPTLGRGLVLGSSTVQLIEPGTRYEERVNQLDVRLSKSFTAGRNRLMASVDLYNVFNASPILDLNSRYGPNWLQPTVILPGRLFKFGVQLDF